MTLRHDSSYSSDEDLFPGTQVDRAFSHRGRPKFLSGLVEMADPALRFALSRVPRTGHGPPILGCDEGLSRRWFHDWGGAGYGDYADVVFLTEVLRGVGDRGGGLG